MRSLLPFASGPKSPTSQVDPDSFIRPLPEPVSVRREGKAFVLRWRPQAETTRIFVGPSPQQMARQRPFLRVANQQEAVLTGVETAVRPYFELAFSGGPADGQRLMAAERTLPLQGAANFRDVGGYLTENGRQVRYGLVYRAGMLADLTAADLAYLRALDLRLVCDLRSAEESTRRPDHLPDMPHLRRENRPIESLDRSSRLRSLFTVIFQRSRLSHLMRQGYTAVMIDKHPHVIGDILRWLADDAHLPAVIHCTAGKDRTGLVVALLLHLLGVPEETIVADYTLSNRHYDYFRETLAPDVAPLMKLGVTIDDLWPLLIVEAETLLHALDHMRTQYGSIRQYLHAQAGIDDAVVTQLQEKLLRPIEDDTVTI